MAISSARRAAYDVLIGVQRGVFSSDLLARATTDLVSRDAGLAEEIALGVLRWRAAIDFLIEQLSGRPLRRLDLEVVTALRMGVYQLRWLDRIPAHAAINDSVELIKHARKRSAAGFANAVLRKVNREPVAWPDDATRLSCPKWLLDRWVANYGPDLGGRIAAANLQRPERFVRITPGEPVPVGLESTEIAGAYAGSIGGSRVQDLSSQTIVPLLDLRRGQTFLDLCSAPGNKTEQAMETAVHGVACDVSAARLQHVRRVGIPLVALDATQPLPFSHKFDRILVDAPCSGTGTLMRNPEIKWKLQPADLEDLQNRQIAILRNALALLAPDGRLVYSTCSLEAEENDAVPALAGVGHVRHTSRRIPGQERGDGFFAAVITLGDA
ncbi:MAG TPA: transcription antitermination factor NusB [Bryobacteraceae bacterium]